MASSHLTPASDPPLPESSHPNTCTPALPRRVVVFSKLLSGNRRKSYDQGENAGGNRRKKGDQKDQSEKQQQKKKKKKKKKKGGEKDE